MRLYLFLTLVLGVCQVAVSALVLLSKEYMVWLNLLNPVIIGWALVTMVPCVCMSGRRRLFPIFCLGVYAIEAVIWMFAIMPLEHVEAHVFDAIVAKCNMATLPMELGIVIGAVIAIRNSFKS